MFRMDQDQDDKPIPAIERIVGDSSIYLENPQKMQLSKLDPEFLTAGNRFAEFMMQRSPSKMVSGKGKEDVCDSSRAVHEGHRRWLCQH